MNKLRKILTYGWIIGIALINAVNYELFIFPNKFAPAGINGLATMVQYLLGVNVGFISLLINLPLAALVYWRVSKSLALRSMVYVLTFSLALILFDYVDMGVLIYDTGYSAILGPLIGGVIGGACYSWLLKASAYTGGTDFIASLIHKKRPDQSLIGLIFTMNVAVAVLSFFVYDYKMEPVLLCILYSFASSTVSDRNLKSGRQATRFEIITDHPQEISDAIIRKFHHSCTLIPAKGMYKGQEKSVLICIVNKAQVAGVSAIIRKFPNTFATLGQVSEVMGNFRRITPDGKQEVEFLDPGDGRGI